MAKYPGAIQKPITAKKRSPITSYNRVTLHTAVSNATSLFSFFNVAGRADSHFYVREDGTVEQYVDTAYNAYADLEGNDASISIETWDGYGDTWHDGDPVPKWNDKQVDALVSLISWIMKTHKIKMQMATSSKYDDSSKGLAWHRLGIDGNFPALPDVRAGREQRGGGMHWSSSDGKLCPGDNRIKQIANIFAAVKGGDIPDVEPTPGPKPKPDPDGLTVDGFNGPDTVRAQQRIAGTTVDGEISDVSQLTTWIQKWLNKKGYRDQNGKSLAVDGQGYYQNVPEGHDTPKTKTQYALQRYLASTSTGKKMGYKPDGMFSSPSAGIKVLQTEANAGRLFK